MGDPRDLTPEDIQRIGEQIARAGITAQEGIDALWEHRHLIEEFFQGIVQMMVAEMYDGDTYCAVYRMRRLGWLDDGTITGEDLQLALAMEKTIGYETYRLAESLRELWRKIMRAAYG